MRKGPRVPAAGVHAVQRWLRLKVLMRVLEAGKGAVLRMQVSSKVRRVCTVLLVAGPDGLVLLVLLG